jgi:hypothetical protein
LNASRSTSETAIPSAPAAIAASNALTISGISDVSDPVHWKRVPSMADASSIPYCVGTKNGFVVTWFTKTKFQSGVSGKRPTPLPPPPPAAAGSASLSAASPPPLESSPVQAASAPSAAVIPIAFSRSRLVAAGPRAPAPETPGRCGYPLDIGSSSFVASALSRELII